MLVGPYCLKSVLINATWLILGFQVLDSPSQTKRKSRLWFKKELMDSLSIPVGVLCIMMLKWSTSQDATRITALYYWRCNWGKQIERRGRLCSKLASCLILPFLRLSLKLGVKFLGLVMQSKNLQRKPRSGIELTLGTLLHRKRILWLDLMASSDLFLLDLPLFC